MYDNYDMFGAHDDGFESAEADGTPTPLGPDEAMDYIDARNVFAFGLITPSDGGHDGELYVFSPALEPAEFETPPGWVAFECGMGVSFERAPTTHEALLDHLHDEYGEGVAHLTGGGPLDGKTVYAIVDEADLPRGWTYAEPAGYVVSEDDDVATETYYIMRVAEGSPGHGKAMDIVREHDAESETHYVDGPSGNKGLVTTDRDVYEAWERDNFMVHETDDVPFGY